MYACHTGLAEVRNCMTKSGRSQSEAHSDMSCLTSIAVAARRCTYDLVAGMCSSAPSCALLLYGVPTDVMGHEASARAAAIAGMLHCFDFQQTKDGVVEITKVRDALRNGEPEGYAHYIFVEVMHRSVFYA